MTSQINAARELPRCKAQGRGMPSRALARAIVLAVVGLFNFAGEPAAHSATVDDGWIGKRVVQKYARFDLKIENRIIVPKVLAVYRVERINGALALAGTEG